MNSINTQISILYRLSQTYLSKKMKVYGLGHSQIETLIYLSTHDEVNQNDIIDHLSLDKGSVSSMIKKLVQNGYINKSTSPTDKRASLLQLTYKSTLLLSQIKDANHQLATKLLDGFNSEERREIDELLKKMRDNMELMTASLSNWN